jgi:hypothetical protein
MHADDERQPLLNDPAREAVASMRGYWAQIWRSVLAWVELGETERLYLEGAEDIDCVSGLAAETVQVKDTARNITLRSGDVIEAIDNAWAHQQRNKQYTIKFRFLTTAGIGVEQDSPFGRGIGGLQLWRESRLSTNVALRERDARAIAEFLLDQGKLSTPLEAFLREASAAQIWQQVITPIEWDTNAEEAPEVIRQIKHRLVILGEKYGVTPDKAADEAEYLYTIAYATATRQKDRCLIRADLLKLFQDRTRVSLPADTVNAVFAAIPQLLAQPGPLPIAVGGKSGAVGRPPPLPARYFARQAILADITGRLSSYPVLVLQGATGVGKSIAAVAHAAASTSSWGWVDLRGVPPSSLRDMLDRVVAELSAEDGLTDVVLDDIELPADSRSLETPIANIKTILAGRRGHLAITSAVALPQRLSLALSLPVTGTISIPPFSRDEITEFLIARGCPGAPIAGWWAAFVELHTRGHAQLVHARMAALEAQGFPPPDKDSFIVTPPDVMEARAEARRLVATMDAPTRELIYRLSITLHALPRRQVLAIAGQPPPIAEPGLAFDKLVGPWLETVAEGLYRVSPLLSGLGLEIQGEAWATAMHRGIAHTLLGFHTLSPTDVSTILFHSMAAQDWSAVAHLAYGIVRSDNETWEALAQSADWFVLVGTGDAIRPNTDAYSLFLIRVLQFRLAAASRNEKGAASVIACLDEELPPTIEEMPLRLARHYFLGQVLLRTELNLPMTQLVSMRLEHIRLADELKEVLADVHDAESDRALAGPEGATDWAGVAGSTLMPHLTDRHSLTALCEMCEPEDANTVRRLLWFMGGQESAAQLIFDRIWLAEFNTPVPDWLACREAFQRVYSLARRCALPGLAQGAARAIARLIDENLNDPEEALRIADTMGAEIGRSPGQNDGRASILFNKGDDAGALAIWRELLPRWTPHDQFDLQQTFSHRLAAVAAARLGEWTEAADWLRSARALADEATQATYSAGLLVDEGFARWQGGDDRRALDCLVEGLTAIDRLPADDTDDRAYLLRKFAGHTIMWIAHTASGSPPEGFPAPPPACCSRLEALKQAKGPSTPSDAIWTHVLEFEFLAQLGDEQFRAHESRLKPSPYGVVRFTFNRLRLQQRLRNLALDDFVEAVGDWTHSVALYQRYYKEDGLRPADPLPADAIPFDDRQEIDTEQFVLSKMFNAMVAIAARGTITKELLEQWETSASRAGLSGILAPWLAFVAGLFVDNSIDAQAAARDTSRAWYYQAVASLRIAVDTGTRPVELLSIHHYWTQILPQLGSELYVLTDLEHLVSLAWRRLSENRFLLRTPAQTVPPLQRACASASTGWRKIGEVLIAACGVVPATVPTGFRQRFTGLK